MSKHIFAVLLTIGLTLAASAGAFAISNVAYEIDDGIVLKLDKADEVWFSGQAPEFSPDGKKLGFLREGNVYVLDLRTWKCEQITKLPAQKPLEWDFRLRLRWHPSGDAIAYTRLQPYKYVPGDQVMVPIKTLNEDDLSECALSTIWVVNLKTRETWRAVGPMGHFAEMFRTYQLMGASVYEPFFSPDGKYLGFVNAGSLFQQLFTNKKPDVAPKPHSVAWTGYLDFASPGASKSGEGVYELQWDAKHQRLDYWIERFWGSGSSSFGYVPWVHGKWGKAQKWEPVFGESIENRSYTWSLAIDRQGRLWCRAASVWTRSDGRAALPEGADHPTFR